MLTESSLLSFPKKTQELQHLIRELENKQLNSQITGKYQDAENCRLDAIQSKKRLENTRLNQIITRHHDQRFQLQNAYKDQIQQFNDFWNSNQVDMQADGKRALQEIQLTHENQKQDLLTSLNNTLPSKIKQSVEILNLRKMEQHMSKQKRYKEAQYVQARIVDLLKPQTEKWERQRNSKICTRLNQLKEKQKIQLGALQKKILSSIDELNIMRAKQLQRLQMKYNNIKEDQRSAQQKQLLHFRGQLKARFPLESFQGYSRIY